MYLCIYIYDYIIYHQQKMMITPTKSGDRTNSKWYFNATHTPKRSTPSSHKAWGDESSVRACHWGTLRCPWIWPTANQIMETYWVCLNIGYVIFQFQWIILRQKSSFSLVKWLCRGIIYIYTHVYIYVYILFLLGVVGSPVAPDMGWLLGYAVWCFSTPRLAKIPSIIDLEPTRPPLHHWAYPDCCQQMCGKWGWELMTLGSLRVVQNKIASHC
jgi:hypothetical protein